MTCSARWSVQNGSIHPYSKVRTVKPRELLEWGIHRTCNLSGNSELRLSTRRQHRDSPAFPRRQVGSDESQEIADAIHSDIGDSPGDRRRISGLSSLARSVGRAG